MASKADLKKFPFSSAHLLKMWLTTWAWLMLSIQPSKDGSTVPDIVKTSYQPATCVELQSIAITASSTSPSCLHTVEYDEYDL